MKLSIPRPNQGKPKGGYYRKGKANREWLYGRKRSSGQKAQSPVKEWAEMTDEEKRTIKEQLEKRNAFSTFPPDRGVHWMPAERTV